jgi:hypothetical protein
MQQAIEEAAAGEFDGDEFGDGKCVLFMYGPDADRLFGVIETVAEDCFCGGRRVRDPNSPQVRVTS